MQLPYLFCELLFAQLVEREELARQNDVVKETATSEFNSNDDLSVRNHHGDRSELDFKILGKFLATCIPRVLEEKGN